jgi:hypothetical protein
MHLFIGASVLVDCKASQLASGRFIKDYLRNLTCCTLNKKKLLPILNDLPNIKPANNFVNKKN